MEKPSKAWSVWQQHAAWLAAITFVLAPLFPLPPLLYLSVVLVYYSARGLKRSFQSRLAARKVRPIGKLIVPALLLGAILPFFAPPDTLPPLPPGLSGLQQYLLLAGGTAVASFGILWLIDSFISLPLDFVGWRRRRRAELRQAAERNAAEARNRETEASQRAAASVRISDQQRRIETRAQCELTYSLHGSEIDDRFPKTMLDAFMQTYMNDSQPVEAVERRGRELQRIIQQHREAEKPAKKFHTIQELAEWFVQEKDRIQTLPIDEELREEHLVQLNMRYAELTQDMLQKMEP